MNKSLFEHPLTADEMTTLENLLAKVASYEIDGKLIVKYYLPYGEIEFVREELPNK